MWIEQLLRHRPSPPSGAAAVGLILGLVLGLALGACLGAVILRGACWLYNQFAGGKDSPSAVPEPAFGRAIGIALATTLVNAAVSVGVVLFALRLKVPGAVADAISVPAAFLSFAGMLSLLLPTTFARGALVAIAHHVMAIVIAVAVVLAIVAAGIDLTWITQ